MEPFKNAFNPEVAARIAAAIARQYPEFDKASFTKDLDKKLKPLELKGRVAFLAERLHQHLPRDMKKSIGFLVGALKKNEKDKIGVEGFAVWPITHFISTYGLDEFEVSMNALKEATKVFTSEFAVRAFFEKDQKRALEFFKLWVEDEDHHVRRLVSEGSRPLLPWGQKLHGFVENPKATWALLEKLKNDPSEYVRKSVANHLNDHSKNHPEFVIDKLTDWYKNKKKTPEVEWVIKHASRSLIKKGYKKAFALHGVEEAKIKIHNAKVLTKKVRLGESLKIEVTLSNLAKKNASLILDHEVHLLKANGKHTIKVFKGKKVTLKALEKMTIAFQVPMKKVTTRVYYPGQHFWNIKINGISEKKQSFILEVKN